MPNSNYTEKRAPIKELPSWEYLNECLAYNPETGELHWKDRPQDHFSKEWVWRQWNDQHAGKIIRNINGKYLRVKLDGVTYYAHRIIWKMVSGEEPEGIDHKDGNEQNNKWDNLRWGNHTTQSWNRVRLKNNTSGHTGIYKEGTKWVARIRIDGEKCYLGSFDTSEEAASVYEEKARQTRKEFYPGAY